MLAYRQPGYARTRSILDALRSEGYQVIEVINGRRGLLRYPEVLLRLMQARRRHRPDVYVLGFRGHEVFWPVRLLTAGRPLILDALMSPTESLVMEGKAGRLGSTVGHVLRPFERITLRTATAVLTDTVDHRTLLVDRFGVSGRRIHVVPIGAASDSPPGDEQTETFRVIFYGSMLPLHGADLVAATVRRCPNVDWRVIGGDPANFSQTHHSSWVDLDDILTHELPGASLGLGGPFGDTEQAERVVTGKTVQMLAAGVPVVVADTETHRSMGFVDRHNCLMVPLGDLDALVDAVQWAKAAPPQVLDGIGRKGRALYTQRFGSDVIGASMASAITAVLDGA